MKAAIVLLATLFLFAFTDSKKTGSHKKAVLLNNSKITVAPPDTIPLILVKTEDGQKQPLRMNELKINIEVVGNISRTTMFMNFENKTDRILEGELNFPLGEGQTITRFAMDVNGKLREAVPVEKQKGQQVFEAIVRKNIDPGLLEKTKGNNFKARVYPIPANGNKQIVIAFEQELLSTKAGNLYLLPMQFNDKLDKFSLKVEVFMQELKPKREQNKLANLKFKKYKQNYVAKTEFTDYIANKQIGFVLPETKNTYKTFVEKTDKLSDNDYFYVKLKANEQTKAKKLPNKICLLYDVSSSLEKKDSLKELEVLDAYFKKIKNLKVRLVSFSNDIHTDKTFTIKNADWGKLKNGLLNPNYDGATQLGILELNKYKCDEFILISDGISNFGKAELATNNTPVIVINSVQSADFSYLKYIALSSGGKFINLTKKTTEQAAKMLSEENYQFISANYDKNKITEVYPNKPTILDNNFSVCGQLIADNAELSLNFGFGNQIMETIKVSLSKENIISESNLIQHIWAAKKLDDLGLRYKKNKDKIIDIGKKYHIVTRNTSLIILDQIDDYLQYEIIPPKELQNEYYAIFKRQKKENLNKTLKHIEQVVNMYNKRIEWWDTKFTQERKKIVKKEKYTQDTIRLIEIVDDAEYDEMEVSAEETTMIEDVENPDAPMMEMVIEHNIPSPSNNRHASIKLNAWDPQTPYLDKLKKTAKENSYAEYLKLKKQYESTPSFFLDVSDYLIKTGNQKQALRVLSNIAELKLQNHELLRILAHRLEQLAQYELAISIYQDVLLIRAEEPQSYRDLALCLAADKQYQKAVDILYTAIKKQWDSRFPRIEEIMCYEMNKIIDNAAGKVNTKQIDKRLLKNLPTDVRVVLNWDTDNSDMDLWVTDPYGVKCYYQHSRTYTGGRISNDFTGGYGPEEFIIKNALKGRYVIQTNYYGSTAQRIAGPTTIYLELYTNYGGKKEKKEVITMRLSEKKEVIDIGELIFK